MSGLIQQKERPGDGLISTSGLRYVNLHQTAQMGRPRGRRGQSGEESTVRNGGHLSSLQKMAFSRIFSTYPPTHPFTAAFNEELSPWRTLISRMLFELCRENSDPLYPWIPSNGPQKLLQCIAITQDNLVTYILATLTAPPTALRYSNELFGGIRVVEKEVSIPQSCESSRATPRKLITVNMVNKSLTSSLQHPIQEYNLDFFEWIWKLWTFTTGFMISLEDQYKKQPKADGSVVYKLCQGDPSISPSMALQSVYEFLKTNHDAAATTIRKFDSSGTHMQRCNFCATLHESPLWVFPVLSFPIISIKQGFGNFAVGGSIARTFLDSKPERQATASEEHLISNGLEALQYISPWHSPMLSSDVVSRVALPPLPFKLQGLSSMRAEIDALHNYCSIRTRWRQQFYGSQSIDHQLRALANTIIIHEILVDLLDTRRKDFTMNDWPSSEIALPVLNWVRLNCEQSNEMNYSFWSTLLSPATISVVTRCWPNYIRPAVIKFSVGKGKNITADLVHQYQHDNTPVKIQKVSTKVSSTCNVFESESLDNDQSKVEFPAFELTPFSLPPSLCWKTVYQKRLRPKSELCIRIPPSDDYRSLTNGWLNATVKLLVDGRVKPVRHLRANDCPHLLPMIWSELMQAWTKLADLDMEMSHIQQETTFADGFESLESKIEVLPTTIMTSADKKMKHVKKVPEKLSAEIIKAIGSPECSSSVRKKDCDPLTADPRQQTPQGTTVKRHGHQPGKSHALPKKRRLSPSLNKTESRVSIFWTKQGRAIAETKDRHDVKGEIHMQLRSSDIKVEGRMIY